MLTDPVSDFIPEFKNIYVIMSSPVSDSLIAILATSEITIRNLFNHTSGITYGGGLHSKYYQPADMKICLTLTKGTIEQMIKKLEVNDEK